jgi:CPA2 family monovalent cation:H+ antiporter-2
VRLSYSSDDLTESFLFQLIVLLALTGAGLLIFERLRLPAVAGFLVVGALAGPGGLGIVDDSQQVRTLAELGVVFLLFEIGLELPLERVRALWRNALLAGGSQVLITVGLIWAGSVALDLPRTEAIVLGGLVAMSSTALVMRLLADRGQIDAPHGQLAVSILVFQDLSIVPFLLAIPLLSSDQGSDWGGLALELIRALAALAVVAVVVRFAVPRVLAGAARQGSPDLFSLLALLVVLGSAYFAEEVGLTLAVGAFLAGMAAGASPYAHQMFSEVVPLRGVLLGLFFTAVGMLFDPSVLANDASLVLGYLATATILKALIIIGISVLLMRQGIRIGILTGFALAQTGEFSFVFAEAAARAGLLQPWLHQIVIAGSILSLIATPFLIQAASRVADWIEGVVEPTSQASEEAHSAQQRVVVIGFGPAGQTLTRLLHALEIPYLVTDANVRSVQEAQARGEPIVFADATRPAVLQRLEVTRARLVVVAISDALATQRIVSRIRSIAPNVPVLARTRYVQEIDPLSQAGASVVVAEEFEGSLELVAQALALFKVPAGAVRNFTDALRDEGYMGIRDSASVSMDPWLVEILDEASTEWVDLPNRFRSEQTLSDLAIRSRTGATLLAIDHLGATVANPPSDTVLRPGDRLLVLGDAPAMDKLRELIETEASAAPDDAAG